MSTVGKPSLRERVRRILQFEITVKKVKPVQLMAFCRYLSVFLTAGVQILDALEIIRTETTDKQLKATIVEISASLRAGDNFSTAVAAHSRAFPTYFVTMVASAEATGQLAPVLAQIARYIERDVAARQRLKSAITYPAVVIALAIVSVTVLVTFVLPRFVAFFKSFDVRLPLATRMLIAVSKFVEAWGLVVVGVIVAVVVLLGASMLMRRGRLLRDHALLRMPLIGQVALYTVVERFCRILGSMVEAGVPLPVGMDLAATGSSNLFFSQKLGAARREMIGGGGLYGPLARTGLFPSAAVQMLRVGEETATLDERLEEISQFYGKELEYRLKRLTDLLEPTAVIVVGIMVGFVAIAIISAIYGVYHGVKIQ